MPYTCSNPESYVGKKVGNGQCVIFVQECANAPSAGTWKKGAIVKGNTLIAKGTAIATFDAAGKYANNPSGNHAAIYVSQDANGIWVYDQWVAQGSVQKRHINFRNGAGSASNDGDAFSVID